MLTRDNLVGSWAGLPVAWTNDDTFDEETYRGNVRRCCEIGMPGVYTGGTTGEFYAMEFDEFQAVARATVEECHAHDTPVLIGCTSTYTRGVWRRMEVAAELGADGVQIALPFWMELQPDAITGFFRDVGSAMGDMALSVYETQRARVALTLDQHKAVKETIPNYLMVKANEQTLGFTPDGCEALSEFVNVFVGEHVWDKLGPRGAIGCCSALVYWNPRVILTHWENLKSKNWSAVQACCTKLKKISEFYGSQYGSRGILDSAGDRLGGRAAGFLKTSLRSRGPYAATTPDDEEALRQWYRENFPEMLEWK